MRMHPFLRSPRRQLILLTIAAGLIYILLHSSLENSWSWRGSSNRAANPDFQFVIPVHLRRRQLTGGTGNDGSVKENTTTTPRGCQIPQLNAYDPSIIHVIDDVPAADAVLDCESSHPLLFNSNLDSTITPAKGIGHFPKNGYDSCCYRTVERDHNSDKPDDTEIFSTKCFPLSLSNATAIPPEHEFIAIYCKKFGATERTMVDVHPFVPLKHRNRSLTKAPGRRDGRRKFNVLIIGLDSVSRMMFLRTMPESYAFLKTQLDAVEMRGYNKLGENSFSNLLPMLSSLKETELNCFASVNFDQCPLIWKKFAKAGYYTALTEDAPGSAIFNWEGRTEFHEQPTDYYLRPLSRVADLNIGTHRVREPRCHGPRPTVQVLLDYMEKFVHRMGKNKKNFFHFSWTTALTQDYADSGKFVEHHLLNALKWLKGSGYLANTIFILMSDHGQRSSKIRYTIQGQLEDSLPFMFVVVPEMFKREHPQAYRNLRTNSDKLTTTFDLHETLQDILSLERIKGILLTKRQASLSLGGKSTSLPRGISLFLRIPQTRTCRMAQIDPMFCSCNYMESISLTAPVLKNAALAAVSHINSILAGNGQCAHLWLTNVTMAERVGLPDQRWEAYLINFQTTPGRGKFEALVGRQRSQPWKVWGEVIRTNLKENRNNCVQPFILKQYCYCI